MPRTTVSGASRRPAILLAAAAAALLAVGVAGCGSSDQPSTESSPTASASAATEVLGVRDPWVKAADHGMSAAFATLVNDGDTDVTVTAVATDVSPMELHGMSMKDGKMVMQPKEGGMVVKAKSTYVLEPGGDHLMMLDLKQPVQAGDELTFTLTFADGRTQTFTAVAKPFTGAQEDYEPGHGDSHGHDQPTPHESTSSAA
ncbi:copper chaperone PCu(A)C [Micromonospora sp. NPDC048999]|uniref:copper chaperone PCu(A)C n=1 Tax=Micromonospora sp. NPDC048999 TaxID=3155391 RepID=UPI0033D5F302